MFIIFAKLAYFNEDKVGTEGTFWRGTDITEFQFSRCRVVWLFYQRFQTGASRFTFSISYFDNKWFENINKYLDSRTFQLSHKFNPSNFALNQSKPSDKTREGVVTLFSLSFSSKGHHKLLTWCVYITYRRNLMLINVLIFNVIKVESIRKYLRKSRVIQWLQDRIYWSD